MTRLVLSSRNKGKLVELQRMLATIAPHIKPVSVSDFPEISDVEETGATFEENALLKAETIAMKTGLAAIADDSGLCIDALMVRQECFLRVGLANMEMIEQILKKY